MSYPQQNQPGMPGPSWEQAQPPASGTGQRSVTDPRITYTAALIVGLGVAGFFFGFGSFASGGSESLSFFEVIQPLHPMMLLSAGAMAGAAAGLRSTFGLALAAIIAAVSSLGMLANLQGVDDMSEIGWAYWMIFALGLIMMALILFVLLIALGRIGTARPTVPAGYGYPGGYPAGPGAYPTQPGGYPGGAGYPTPTGYGTPPAAPYPAAAQPTGPAEPRPTAPAEPPADRAEQERPDLEQ